ncbi:PHA/PHB synthase family protein [Sphingobium aromaticiconvertens]|uniref:PHA/PHB synthase family protein n=1 Tax=Sphingobium aromaticiconvertens TaxID=365341 RepID=UPI00301B01BC
MSQVTGNEEQAVVSLSTPDGTATKCAGGPYDGWAELFLRPTRAAVATLTGGLAPSSLGEAFADWATHLALFPGSQMHIVAETVREFMSLAGGEWRTAASAGAPKPQAGPPTREHRFDDPSWEAWPFDLIRQSFLHSERWWDEAACDILGVTAQHRAIMRFSIHRILDMLAPSNFVATNPVLQHRIIETQGKCLVDGLATLIEDWLRSLAGERPAGAECYRPGADVAITPGKVVYRNDLIELIQYAPTTQAVRPEPLLIVPAWILKYYVLDLSLENSLVRWLVGQGHTVFMISWRNVGEGGRALDLEDYRRLGIMASLDAITAITGGNRVHATGYCLGGTLLAIAAAAMARDGDDRFASMTLFAAQTDFSEPGEVGLFIDAAQLDFLETMARARGYLDSAQMSGAFQALRSNELVWPYFVRDYLMGARGPMSDLQAWHSDATRLPFAAHSQYLHSLALANDLAEGRYEVDGRPIPLENIHVPVFAVGAESDYVAPWRSVYKIHRLMGTEVTFLLTTGGHDDGIVSEPGHPDRFYRLLARPADADGVDPETWMARTSSEAGSWWPAWAAWLDLHSSPPGVPPPLGGSGVNAGTLGNAPGSYVLES